MLIVACSPVENSGVTTFSLELTRSNGDYLQKPESRGSSLEKAHLLEMDVMGGLLSRLVKPSPNSEQIGGMNRILEQPTRYLKSIEAAESVMWHSSARLSDRTFAVALAGGSPLIRLLQKHESKCANLLVALSSSVAVVDSGRCSSARDRAVVTNADIVFILLNLKHEASIERGKALADSFTKVLNERHIEQKRYLITTGMWEECAPDAIGEHLGIKHVSHLPDPGVRLGEQVNSDYRTEIDRIRDQFVFKTKRGEKDSKNANKKSKKASKESTLEAKLKRARKSKKPKKPKGE